MVTLNTLFSTSMVANKYLYSVTSVSAKIRLAAGEFSSFNKFLSCESIEKKATSEPEIMAEAAKSTITTPIAMPIAIISYAERFGK